MEHLTTRRFPEGFYFGASTSAMQTEGGIGNNDWAEAERLGKTPPIGNACDFYARYESDLDIAASLHLNAFRFSVEWARVEPEEGRFDEEALSHYRAMVKAVRARGMEPFVCVWHFSLPLWFVKSGSFGRKDSAAVFARYAKKVTEALGEEVRYYLTMNEPTVWLGEHGRILGASPGFSPNPLKGLSYMRKLQDAHMKAYEAMKEADPALSIGIATHFISFLGTGPIGRVFARVAWYFWNDLFLVPLKKHQDFIGIQFYQRRSFWQPEEHRRTAIVSDIGWHLHPDAIESVLVEASRYGVPLIVTESGIADAKDKYRARFIYESLEGILRAIQKGADVRGYLHWSLLDNYEFAHGYSMRFGLVEVDHRTQKRKVRVSAEEYGAIVRRRELPEAPPAVY